MDYERHLSRKLMNLQAENEELLRRNETRVMKIEELMISNETVAKKVQELCANNHQLSKINEELVRSVALFEAKVLKLQLIFIVLLVMFFAICLGVSDKYYEKAKSKKSTLSLGSQILDEDYSLGKSLKQKHIKQLASKGDQMYAINMVMTAANVLVEGFCMTCGTHGSSKSSAPINDKHHKHAYIWVGNSETQCLDQCAWPFHQPIYGPQNPPLVAPNQDVGMDGMVINLASLLSGTGTNPFGKGYYQGEAGALMAFEYEVLELQISLIIWSNIRTKIRQPRQNEDLR
ncbi:hypothetical protein RHGRI_004219 [Rhododendron griersonianum]|uniref:Uncharacterized protein n=1 Tax=Rhododendron griersonianum TaxID=479676 RepID=A0AAV6LAT2_9ERIC|nr:hypothetical protein RHGRI_004219 [Rhododendron griersonianum]